MNRRLILILMAAGSASRFGSNKLLHEIDGKPMVRHVFDRLLAYWQTHRESTELVVVSRFPAILQLAAEEGLRAVINDDPDAGIALTIRLGLAGLTGQTEEAAVFFTADQPYLQEATIRDFLEQARREEKGILTAVGESGLGNPVSFDRKYYAALRALEGDTGGRQVMLDNRQDTALFHMAEEELRDIDQAGQVVPKA